MSETKHILTVLTWLLISVFGYLVITLLVQFLTYPNKPIVETISFILVPSLLPASIAFTIGLLLFKFKLLVTGSVRVIPVLAALVSGLNLLVNWEGCEGLSCIGPALFQLVTIALFMIMTPIFFIALEIKYRSDNNGRKLPYELYWLIFIFFGGFFGSFLPQILQ